MRVFLDACVDPRVAALLQRYNARIEVTTAFDLGWHALKDHTLLPRIQDQFDSFLTTDKGFELEHNLKNLRFGIIVVHVAKNKVEYYEPLIPRILDALDRRGPGKVDTSSASAIAATGAWIIGARGLTPATPLSISRTIAVGDGSAPMTSAYNWIASLARPVNSSIVSPGIMIVGNSGTYAL